MHFRKKNHLTKDKKKKKMKKRNGEGKGSWGKANSPGLPPQLDECIYFFQAYIHACNVRIHLLPDYAKTVCLSKMWNAECVCIV
jgi:hypothetical protein